MSARASYPAITASTGRRLLAIVSMVRYRFFLYAGLLPYVLGTAWFASAGGAP